MRFKPTMLLALLTWASGIEAGAEQPPAATVLVPYFEVDDVGGPACGQARNTTVTITNTVATETLAKVTVWSDHGIPLINFNVYFHPSTVVQMDLGEMICVGNIPITGPTQPPGSAGDPGADFPECNNFFPFFMNPVIQGTAADRLKNGATGQLVASKGQCAGHAYGDGIARGYVTVDLVGQCGLLFPSAPDYETELAPGNVLTGTVTYRGLDGSYEFTSAAVPVQGGSFGPGEHTFYGRYDGGSPTGEDGRAPLSGRFLVPLIAGDAGSTLLVYWREGDGSGDNGFFDCASPPAELGAVSDNVLLFDQSGAPAVATVAPPLQAGIFPWTGIPGTPSLGVADIDLSHGEIAYPDPDTMAQAWVITINDPVEGPPSVHPGTESTGIFRSGFEQPISP